MGVLEGDQAAERLVGVVRVAEGGLDRGRVEGAVGSVLEGRATLAPTTTAWPAASSIDDVVLGAGDDLLAAAEVGHLRDEIAHRAAGDEQPGLLAEQLRGALLEGDDGRVVAEDVVADLGLGHRPAHRRRGPR